MKKGIIIILISFYLISLAYAYSINTLDNTNNCFQEFTNIPSNCAINNLGSYSFGGTFVDSQNLTDGNYLTFAQTYTNSEFNATYYKPLNVNLSSIWIAGYYGMNEYYAIPSDCFNQNPIIINIKPTYSFTGSYGKHNYTCWNGTDSKLISDNSNPATFTEEAMNWSLNIVSNQSENITYLVNQSLLKYIKIPQNVTYITNARMNLTEFQMQCYQETANSSSIVDNNCQLNYTGIYNSSDSPIRWSNLNNLYDGDWNTYTSIPSNSVNTIFINYTKPPIIGLQSVLWEAKYGNSGIITNFTLNQSCYTYNNSTLALKIIFSISPSSFVYFTPQCYNGTNFLTIANISTNNKLYEEAIIWFYNNTNVNISISNNQIYYFDKTFNQINNRTNNFYSYINQYLSSCSIIGGYCNVPILFNSASAGILQYSDLQFDNFGFTENNFTINNQSLELTNTYAIGNFTIPITPTNIYLYYNNTRYTPIIITSGINYYLNTTILTPSITKDKNITDIHYEFLINGTYYNSSFLNQTVKNIELIGNCSTGNYSFINFTNINEETLAKTVGTIEYTITLTNLDNTITEINGSVTGENTSICSTQNLSNSAITYSVQLRYYGTNYLYKTYNIQDASVNNLPLLIPLYFLSNSSGIGFIINYVDFNYLIHPNAIIQIQRQYLSDNTYKIVEIPLIANDGSAKGSFDTNNIRYKLIVIENGQIIDEFDNVFPVCQNLVLGTCTISERGQQAITTQTSGDFSYTMNNVNNSLIMTYIIPSGTPKLITLLTAQNSRFLSNITTCSNSLFSSGGTIICNYNDTVGDSDLNIQVDINNAPSLFSSLHIPEELNDIFLGNNYFIAFILILSLVLIFVTSGIAKLIISGIGVMFLGTIFLIKGVNIGTIATSLSWLLIVIVIAIYEINKHEENFL